MFEPKNSGNNQVLNYMKPSRSPTYQSSEMFEAMGANGPLGANPPSSVNQSMGDVHKASFNYAKLV